MYSFESRVRYSETDERGRLSVKSAMDYLQDCSTFQSEDIGLGLKYLRRNHRAWWLAAWQIEFVSLPALGDRINISTWAYDFKGMYGYRNFTIRDTEGNYLLKADSTWFLYDLEANRPVKVTESDISGYMSAAEKRLDMKPMERKLTLPEHGRDAGKVLVSKHHLDTNHHVNNAQYVEIAREAIDDNFKIAGLNAQYKKAAVLGDIIYPRVYDTDKGYLVELKDSGGEQFAIVRMIRL